MRSKAAVLLGVTAARASSNLCWLSMLNASRSDLQKSKRQTHMSLTVVHSNLDILPELLCFYKPFAELCFHAKCGCKLAAVDALCVSDGGVHGSECALDAVQELRRGILFPSGEGSHFMFAELDAKIP